MIKPTPRSDLTKEASEVLVGQMLEFFDSPEDMWQLSEPPLRTASILCVHGLL